MQFRLSQQRLCLRIILLTKLVPRLTVNIADFQRQFAATHILALQLQAVNRVIELAVHFLAVSRKVGFAIQRHTFQNGQLFAFNGDRHFIQADFLVANAFVEARQFAAAFGFEIIKGELHLLIVFVDRIYEAAFRFTSKRHDVTVTVCRKFKITAAERHFFSVFFIVQRFEIDS